MASARTTRVSLTGHTSQVTGVAIAPDGTWLASASLDRTARVWKSPTADVKAGDLTEVRTDSALAGCVWFPLGTTLCVAGQRGIYVLDLTPPGNADPAGDLE